MIPKQLQGYRFIKVNADKKPTETMWQKEGGNNYQYDDASFQDYLKISGIYGVATGFNNLLIIDFDNRIIQNKVVPKLPKTFTVISAGKLLFHKYFKVDSPESFKIKDVNGKTLVDVQGKGKQAIGPNSKLSNGRTYKIDDDLPIAEISIIEIKDLFKDWINLTDKIKSKSKVETDPICKAIKEKIKVPDLLREFGIDITKSNTDCPFHASEGHRCLSYNDEVWYCWDCEKYGNIFQLFMEKNKINFIEAKKRLATKAKIVLNKPRTSDFFY